MMYPGRHATWLYIIGVPYCHVKNILIFMRMAAQAFQKYSWKVSLRRIHVLGVVEWSVYLCNSVVILQVWQERLVVPTIIISNFWPIRQRDKRLSPLLQHDIFSLIPYFFTHIQPIFFRFGAHISLDIFTKIVYPYMVYPRYPQSTQGSRGTQGKLIS